ncbi:hypothetical protein [Streptomyces sp. CA-251247]|uniref:hypothetical protein n=1 Tax=Streptomyces sp. CA-251247 TaxID=3240062 RepID=UPI003D8A3F5B
MVKPVRMGASSTTEVAVPAPSMEPFSTTAELNSVGQLAPAEQEKVRQARAGRILRGPNLDPSLSPAEALTVLENVISTAAAKRDETIRAARNAAAAKFVDEAGPAMMQIRDRELYRVNHPERTFEQYALEVWGYSESHVYTLMDSVMVRAALGVAGSSEQQEVPLNTGHVRALAPAIRAHGPEVARKMWADAQETGRVTEKTLRDARKRIAGETSEASEVSDVSSGTSEASEVRQDAIASLRQTLALLQKAYDNLGDGTGKAARVADPGEAEQLLHEIARYGGRIAHRART